MTASPLRSMTGYGRGEAAGECGKFIVELRSVNSRFCEVSVSLPRELSPLETKLRARLKGEIARGKLDCRVTHERARAQAPPVRFNEDLFENYRAELTRLAADRSVTADLALSWLVHLPGVIEVTEADAGLEVHEQVIDEAVGAALAAFESERAREGEALGAHFLAELAAMRSLRGAVFEGRDQVLVRYRERLGKRVADLQEAIGVQIEPGRIEAEIAIMADKCDVSEELVRLEAHLDRFEQLVREPTDRTPGRAMEFLLQEINREVNTTASKARDLEIAQATLEMKACMERIREQAHNVE